mgnify:CR=1 FL=1
MGQGNCTEKKNQNAESGAESGAESAESGTIVTASNKKKADDKRKEELTKITEQSPRNSGFFY